MTDLVIINIPGPLRGKQRPRATRGGRVYTPQETRNAEAFIKMLGAEAMSGSPPITDPLAMNVAIYVDIPASFSRKKREAAISGAISPTKKPDLDNCVKLVCDALNGVVYKDDCQVVELTVSKEYGVTAYTSVVISRHTSSTP